MPNEPMNPGTAAHPGQTLRHTDRIARSRPVPLHTRLAALVVAAFVAVLLAACTAAPATVAPPVVGPAADGSADGAATGDVPAAPLDADDVNAWLDGLMPAALEDGGIAGGTVSVVQDGEVLTARGWGTTDLAAERSGDPHPVDPEQTLFRVGSVSKTFTATAVLQLVEQGQLDLDTDISGYLDFEIPRSFDAPLTLRNLLTHTPGFEERIRGLISPEGTKADLRDALISDLPPEQIYEPGSTPAYSNYGYGLAGYIVERVSGVPFEQYLREHVLEPAGMTSSGFEQPLPKALAGRVSKGYPDDSQPALPFEVVNPSPAGALTSSATDMARFMMAQLGQLPPDQAVLDPATLELMHQPGLDSESLGILAEGPRMALGLFDESRNGHRILGHGGDTNVFHSHLQLYPDDGVGIFVSLNSSGPTGAETLAVREALLHGFGDRYFPGAPDSTVEPTAAEHAAMAEGTYSSSRTLSSTFISTVSLVGQTQVVAQDDGTVRISPAPGSVQPADFEEIEPWVWQEVGADLVITMEEDDGQVVAIGHDSAFELLRVDPWRTMPVAFTVLGASALVLVLALLALPVGALVRRRYGVSAPVGRPGRRVRMLTRVASLLALVALAGWFGVLANALSLQDVPDLVLRAVQLPQLLGVLGLIPAGMVVVHAVRRQLGWWRVTGAVLVLLALGGVAWFALAFRLLSPDVSY